jgi:translation elongation factor P/translation initiation factor 5A
MTNVKELRIGAWILHRDEPAKVVKKERVTVGTHMHSKTKLTVKGLFSGNSDVLTLSHHENLEDAEVMKKKAQVVAKVPEQKQIQIMDSVSYETLTAAVTDEEFEKIDEGSEVTFIEFRGKVSILEYVGK